MKKTYISPNTVVVSIMHTQPIAGSNLTTSSATFINEDAGDGDVLTKGMSDVNIWDDEW